MKILFYGRLADAMGRELDIDAPTRSSVGELRQSLVDDHPELAGGLDSKRARSCVADTLVGDDYRLAAGDTLEFLPPVSGG